MTPYSRAELSAYLDGDLSTERAELLREHLAVDAGLREELDALRDLRDRARALAPRPPASELWPGIAARIRAAPVRRPTRWLVPAASLLAGIGIGVLAMTAGRLTPRASEHEPRFLLLLHEPPGMPQLPDAAARAAQVEQYRRWAGELARRGALVLGEKLRDAEGYVLRANEELERTQSDGIGGLFVLRASDYAAARTLARTCPHLALGGSIELRRIE